MTRCSYPEALERVRELQARDDESILPQARTALLTHGSQTDLCVVLFHGYTNHPGQYGQFAPLVFERGANVLIPRLPGHGDRDRMTRRLARVDAPRFLALASEAIDVARGLGSRVRLLGISSSATLCANAVQTRADVERIVGVAPAFALLQMPYALSRFVGRAALVLRNRFLWWDPRIKENQRPSTAYPQFPTRGLAQTMRIADGVYAASNRTAPAGGGAVFACNANDPAVNNRATFRIAANWNRSRPGFANVFTFSDLPHNHDIIDPDNPRARTDVVYPKLIEFLFEA